MDIINRRPTLFSPPATAILHRFLTQTHSHTTMPRESPPSVPCTPPCFTRENYPHYSAIYSYLPLLNIRLDDIEQLTRKRAEIAVPFINHQENTTQKTSIQSPRRSPGGKGPPETTENPSHSHTPTHTRQQHLE